MSTKQASRPQQPVFWLFALTREERATLIATFGGWALDGMDVMIYSFVIPALIAQWHMSQGQAGMLSTVALLLSAAGGWLAGLLADRFGRARILQITILWFAVFTFLSGFTNSFWQLLVTRSLQGLGFGGEWAVGAVLMGEVIRAEHRGKAVGTVQGGWAIGWGVAAICYTLLFSFLPASIAWRVMFWIGILPSLLVFYIQRHVPEPEIFRRTQAQAATVGHGVRFLDIFSPDFVAHYPSRLAPRRRSPGRLLRHYHLAADLSEKHSWIVCTEHRRLPCGGDCRFVCRLPGKRLANGPTRA